MGATVSWLQISVDFPLLVNEYEASGDLYHDIPCFQLQGADRDAMRCIDPLPLVFNELCQVEVTQLHIDEAVWLAGNVVNREHLDYVFVARVAKLGNCPQLVFKDLIGIDSEQIEDLPGKNLSKVVSKRLVRELPCRFLCPPSRSPF